MHNRMENECAHSTSRLERGGRALSKFRDIFRGRAKYVTVRSPVVKDARTKKDVPDPLWTKCNGCGTPLYHKDLEKDLFVCAKCGFHHRVGAFERIRQVADDMDDFVEFDDNLRSTDPLNFPHYEEKLQSDFEKTGLFDAIVTGKGYVGGRHAVLIAMDFSFRGGSMGSVVGEKVVRAFERASEKNLPVIAFSASGGARMQEGILSLIQMQKTAAAVEHHNRKGLLYISVFTNPTLAGVFGSYAALGDIHLAEPGATVGFAGPTVIEEAIRRPIPADLQSAETVFEHGFIDKVVPRQELKNALVQLLRLHNPKQSNQPQTSSEQAEVAQTNSG